MGPFSLIEYVRNLIGSIALSIAFKTFLWVNRTTQEQYWKDVWQAEERDRRKEQISRIELKNGSPDQEFYRT